MLFEGFQGGFYSTKGKCIERLQLKTENIRKSSENNVFWCNVEHREKLFR